MENYLLIPLSPQKRTYKELSFNLVGFFYAQKMHQKCTTPISIHSYGLFLRPNKLLFSYTIYNEV